jgi:hypothetical protein
VTIRWRSGNPGPGERSTPVLLFGPGVHERRDGDTAFDSLEMLKQLGLWRTLLAAPSLLRALRDGHPG